MSGFDLSEATKVVEQEDQGQQVHLRDQAGEPMYNGDAPVTVTVVGTYSSRYRNALEAKRDKRLQAKRNDMDAIREDALDVTAQCVIAWDGIYDGGEPLECNKANALRVLKGVPWVREQIEQAMDDHAGFSVSSSSS